MALDTLKSPQELSKDKPHGTRMKYMGGCRCIPCRAANSRYISKLYHEVKETGRKKGIVSAEKARQHLLELSRRGIGRRAVGEASGVSPTILHEIKMGRRKRIFARTEYRILQVDERARGGAAIIPAGPTWKLINALLREGFTKGYLALRLGRKSPALQIHPKRILASTAMAVEKLHHALMTKGRKE